MNEPQLPPPTLPLALRDDELTENDVAVLLRVAMDKDAPAGRYTRTPKRLSDAPTERLS